MAGWQLVQGASRVPINRHRSLASSAALLIAGVARVAVGSTAKTLGRLSLPDRLTALGGGVCGPPAYPAAFYVERRASLTDPPPLGSIGPISLLAIFDMWQPGVSRLPLTYTGVAECCRSARNACGQPLLSPALFATQHDIRPGCASMANVMGRCPDAHRTLHPLQLSPGDG
jgi:hypothetical protein